VVFSFNACLVDGGPRLCRMTPDAAVRSLTLWSGDPVLEPMHGGVSNASFRVTDASGDYVARVGHDYPCHQVSRVREAIASRAAYACGLSPELVYAESGISVLRFVKAKTFVEADVRNHWQACLDLITRTHRDMGPKIQGQGTIFWVFQILRDYASQLTQTNHRLAGEVPGWMAAVDRLEAVQIPLPIVFGHHDLLPSNFMDDGQRLWLIDWEYGAFGTAMFDLANLAANNSFEESLEQAMLEAYFGRKPDLSLHRAFAAMKVVSALREAMWGMVSELHLAAPGVDYVAYAKEYLGRYDAIRMAYDSRWT
jgi:thiamine kinase-like enzyme